MLFDDLLKKHNVKYEDLNPVEKETFHAMLDAVEKTNLTIESIKDYISAMKRSVEQELTVIGLGKDQDTFLKARLRNYILLEAFLLSPEKARQALERALTGLAK